MSEDIVAVSLFSGAGGLDIASVMAGVPVISSTDFDTDCIKTLSKLSARAPSGYAKKAAS